MGQCYDVNLRVRFKNEAAAKQALLAKIDKADEERVVYNIPGLRAQGFDLDNIWDLMSVFFCGWGQRLNPTADGGGLYSCFDASYGWEGVMMDAFDKIAPFLEDYSEIVIYPDSGRDWGYVEDGEVTWS